MVFIRLQRIVWPDSVALSRPVLDQSLGLLPGVSHWAQQYLLSAGVHTAVIARHEAFFHCIEGLLPDVE
jgi:hypothetical protein